MPVHSANYASSPEIQNPPDDWPYLWLWEGVREALYALPAYFRTETTISGLMATDVFTLNSVLGASIEEQVVKTLNDMRPIWDPDDRYKLYSFDRQAQTFPDVLLRRKDAREAKEGVAPDHIIMGVELKGWYLLSKEGEPSLRFQVTPSVCAPQDLVVVVPWALSNVVSGSPKVFTPYVQSARYLAEFRNYHWQCARKTKLSRDIRQPTGPLLPYPKKSDRIVDRPKSDRGRNFGRLARTGVMDEYKEAALDQPLAGIQARYWIQFFKVFQENKTPESIRVEIGELAKRLEKDKELAERTAPAVDASRLDIVRSILERLEELVCIEEEH